MPITKTMAYKVGEETFQTLEEAQTAEIYHLISGEVTSDSATVVNDTVIKIVQRKDQIISILTCDPEHEKPARKPRKDKGTKRAKSEAVNRALQDGKQ